jgi:hypothetical protein
MQVCTTATHRIHVYQVVNLKKIKVMGTFEHLKPTHIKHTKSYGKMAAGASRRAAKSSNSAPS